MTNPKLHIKIGTLEFSGEGEQKWLTENLNLIIEKCSEMPQLIPESCKQAELGSEKQKTESSPKNKTEKKALATLIKEKNASTLSDLFLLTAIWIHDNLDQKQIQNIEINKQLKNSSQKPISNLVRELNKNVSAGFIVKSGASFYVTSDGRDHFNL